MNQQQSPLADQQHQQQQQQQQQPQTIKLSIVIHRLVKDSYNQLVGLTEVAPSLKDNDRKKALVEYFDQTREKFLRLLVLLKWSNHVDTLTKANEIIKLLQKEDSYFRDAADLLIMTKENLINARAPIYDIPTAVDVMTSGTYQRLPSNIGMVIPPPLLSGPQITNAIDKLNNIICYKLFLSDIPNDFEPIKVDNGRAHIVVKNEYEAFLTIEGASETDNWSLISFSLFIYSQQQQSKEGNAPIKMRVDERVKEVSERIQNRLTYSKQPLYELHNIIHTLVVSAQLDSLSSQMEALKKTAFKSNIKCVHGKDQSITIFFWISEDIANSIGSLDVKKHMNIRILIDDNQKLHIINTPNIQHPKSDSFLKSTSLSIETILMRTIELNAHYRVQFLYNHLAEDYRNKLKQQEQQQKQQAIANIGSSSGGAIVPFNPSKSFQINDFKLIQSSQQQQQNNKSTVIPTFSTTTSTTNITTTTVTATNPLTASTTQIIDESLPTILRVQLYGSSHMDITVNQLTGKFNILLSSSNNQELITPFESKLNSNAGEIKTIVNTFKLKSLLSCFEEAALFMRLECFYKIPLVSHLFTEQNYICIRFPKYRDIYYLVISIHHITFMPIFHLIYSKSVNMSSIISSESQIKRIESIELNNLIKECEYSPSDQQQFQNGIYRLLKRLVDIAKYQINISSVLQYMQTNDIVYQIHEDHLTFNFTTPIIPKVHLQIQDQITITFPDDNNCCVNFTELSPFSELKSINTKQLSYSDGNWSFFYDTATDFLTSFKNDLIATYKIINLGSQIVKQLQISKEFQNNFQLISIKPTEIEFICVNYSLSKSTIKILVNKQYQLVLDYQPFSNPLLPFFEKDLNENMNIEKLLHSIAISNEIVFSIQAIIYTPNSNTSQFLPLEIYVVPRSSTQIRLIYRNIYGIDIRFVSTENCIVEDAYYTNVMVHLYPQQYRSKLMAIPFLQSIMEYRINVVALDSQGFRSSWLIPMKMFRNSLQRIVLFMSCNCLFSILRSIVRLEFPEAIAQNLSIRFNSDSIQYQLYVRDYLTFELDATNKPNVTTILTKGDFDALSAYFKKRVNLASYRQQTFGSFISLLTVPQLVMSEFLKILRGDQEHQLHKYYIVDICMSSSSGYQTREPFIHKRDLSLIFMVLRYFTRANSTFVGETFVDIPIVYNYQSNQIFFWNRNDSPSQFDPQKISTSSTLTQQDHAKMKIVDTLTQELQPEAASGPILSNFSKSLHKHSEQLMSSCV